MTRRERRNKGIRLMTPRDRWVLHWIADQYGARFDHLQVLLSRDPRTTNPACAPGPQGVTASDVGQVLGRWGREPQWAEYRRMYTDAPGWVAVTQYGMQVLGLGYERHMLKETALEHMHWINCVRLDMERRHPEYTWTSERAIRAAHPRRFPNCERDEGENTGHIPDARIWTGHRSIAVQVELSPKSDQELDDILQALLLGDEANMAHQTVWYFVSSATPLKALARRAVEVARARLPEQQQSRIQLIELEQLSC